MDPYNGPPVIDDSAYLLPQGGEFSWGALGGLIALVAFLGSL